ncbi:hypothetical protein [Cellulomonas sp. URHD0024]|uniref:hypothetical protein n=1 Tax=Cellulomonas sp. URHD0024 TaxID=1302620 RepID=UPI000407838C|nr:hypothetical protein [Cellulomonas sp. URHD0024]
MERELDDVVFQSLTQRVDRLASVAPEPSVLAGTIARVRRRRRRRATGQVFAAVGVVTVLAAGLTVGGEHNRPVPATTPTATPSPSPSASPQPTPTPTLAEAPAPSQAEVDAGLGLPASVAAPADIWDQVGEGWALGIYRSSWSMRDGSSTPLRNSLVVSSPEGVTYRLRELPTDTAVELVRWEPGATKALVTIAPVRDGVTGYSIRGWLDLLTGTLTQEPGAVGEGEAPGISFEGLDHRGDEVWSVRYGQTGGGGPVTIVVQTTDGVLVRRIDLQGDDAHPGLLDPSGHLLAVPGHDEAEMTYDVVDLDTGREKAHQYGVANGFCQVVGWQSGSELLTRCRADSWESSGFDSHLLTPGDSLYVVRLDGGAPRFVRVLGAGDPAVPLWRGRTLPDGRVVVGALPVGADDVGSCIAGLYALDGDTTTALGIDGVARVQPVGTVGSRLYSVTTTSCDGNFRGTQLESLDGSDRTPLLAAPSSASQQLEGGLDTWAVAGGPSGHTWG